MLSQPKVFLFNMVCICRMGWHFYVFYENVVFLCVHEEEEPSDNITPVKQIGYPWALRIDTTINLCFSWPMALWWTFQQNMLRVHQNSTHSIHTSTSVYFVRWRIWFLCSFEWIIRSDTLFLFGKIDIIAFKALNPFSSQLGCCGYHTHWMGFHSIAHRMYGQLLLKYGK